MNHKYYIDGLCLKQYCKEHNINYENCIRRINRSCLTVEEAVTLTKKEMFAKRTKSHKGTTMTWEELASRATILFRYKLIEGKDNVLFNSDLFFYKDGSIYTNERCLARNRTPDEMYKIMEALL